MTGRRYDAIVAGARCAGSPTAMLLARRGYRVLLLDRARFPSDTVSTHLIHAPGVAALRRWGLADRLAATGCPAIRTYRFDFGPLTITGTPRPAHGTAIAYCPRRTLLDKLLIDAAGQAGAERNPGRLHRRRADHPGRHRRGHPRPRPQQAAGGRTGPGGHRRRRRPLPGRGRRGGRPLSP